MVRLKDIDALNIEISSKCNINCTFCMRKEKVRKYGDHLILLADYKLLPASFLANLRRISFGGGFGDLSCNYELPEIAAFSREQNSRVRLEGDTNGSNQKKDWWYSLGSSFSSGAMVFALDGLEDTHRLHRRGADFKKIMSNISAFISGGGTAFWKFILFEHNEHQISGAEELARDLGCSRFFVISSRDYNEQLRKPVSLRRKIKRDIYREYQHSLSEEEKKAICRPLLNKSIYIAADGTVHPCCFAHCMYITEHNKDFQFILPLVKKYQAEINFKTTPIKDIVTGSYFQEVMGKSLNNRYCITKCNKHRNKIRKELVLYEKIF